LDTVTPLGYPDEAAARCGHRRRPQRQAREIRMVTSTSQTHCPVYVDPDRANPVEVAGVCSASISCRARAVRVRAAKRAVLTVPPLVMTPRGGRWRRRLR